MLQCPNPNCQTANAESNRFCTQCQVPLPKRYLWGVDAARRLKPDVVVGDRYRHVGNGIFLDLQPGATAAVATLPVEAQPYLRLIQYRLHVPQVYDWVAYGKVSGDRLLLLYDAAIYRPSIYTASADAPSKQSPRSHPSADPVADGKPRLLPCLSDLWSNASGWRRLNWLWQMAQLWQPFSHHRVTATLLSPDLLRGEGPLVRLQALCPNDQHSHTSEPTLAQLGQIWQGWIAPEPDGDFLAALCQQMIEGKLDRPEQVVNAIDGAIAQLAPARSQTIQLTTQTDQGPSRNRNEDACFPASATLETYHHGGPQSGPASPKATDEEADDPVVIVCDGIGGHQGGDVASQLAIHSICDHLIDQPDIHRGGPLKIFQQLSAALLDANDLISGRNDSEQRRDRQRMGTTVVMALVDDYDCYISHVGDSRAYWITRWGCHQITLDDDVASREVRLGYSTHADAVLRPGAGSLVQALGMARSSSLYPTVQRLILDDVGLLLLCSDGLSDNDLVEIFWPQILLPVLSGETDLATARQALIDMANTQNGYDNVTIGLLHWQVAPPAAAAAKALSLVPPHKASSDRPQASQSTRLQVGSEVLSAAPAALQDTEVPLAGEPAASAAPLKLNVDLRRPAGIAPLIVGIILLLGVSGLLAYAFVPGLGSRLSRIASPVRQQSPDSAGGGPVDPARTDGVSDRIPLSTGVVLQIGPLPGGEASPLPAYAEPINTANTSVNSEGLGDAGQPPQLGTADGAVPPPPQAATLPDPIGYLFPGATAQVLGRSEFSQAVLWVEIEVCQGGDAPSAPAGLPLPPGQSAWVLESSLRALGRIPSGDGGCSVADAPTAPAPPAEPSTPATVPQ
ncbi:MAG: protein phosphatase 2C domain-containing protein [Cyanobacteria bacterium P01_A01_bin.135]